MAGVEGQERLVEVVRGRCWWSVCGRGVTNPAPNTDLSKEGVCARLAAASMELAADFGVASKPASGVKEFDSGIRLSD